ncbi:MAG: hypothetical protein ICV68_17745 [Pyrinomonadaceae bacterium]|nr:hypothetical protein [Pyrinomonadaceae bacterium]
MIKRVLNRYLDWRELKRAEQRLAMHYWVNEFLPNHYYPLLADDPERVKASLK